MYTGVIITHGTMAQCLVGTLSKIAGSDFSLLSVSNEGKDPDSVVDHLGDIVKLPSGEPLFLFSEFIGGSTWFAANKFAQMRKNTFVLSGVNLPMLISFVTKQKNATPEKLAKTIEEDANRGISLKYYGED